MKTWPIILKLIVMLLVCALAYMHFTYRTPLSTAGKTIQDPSHNPTDLHTHKTDIEAIRLPIERHTDFGVNGQKGPQSQPEIENHFSNENRSAAIKPQGKNLNQKKPNSHGWKKENRTSDNSQQSIRNPNKLDANVIETEKDPDLKAELLENSKSVKAQTSGNQQSAVIHPAILVDLDEPSLLTPQQDQEVQAMAESFAQSVNSSGLDPSSIQYKELYNSEALKSDQAFRAKYGERSWMNHHIQSYHLNNPEP
jgi:hypothetical protein